MTRLISEDIEDINDRWDAYELKISAATGGRLPDVGAAAAGIEDRDALMRKVQGIRMAVVPVKSGLGVISGFSEAVCGILKHLGFNAYITPESDVAGFAHAFASDADVILASDDHRFAAFCLKERKFADNTEATARGFVTALDMMARRRSHGLSGEDVLVLGCGVVGRYAVRSLLSLGAKVTVCDISEARSSELAEWTEAALGTRISVVKDPDRALSVHSRIFDATNAAEVIGSRHVRSDTLIAAPGMPCGITPEAGEKLKDRFWHDPLQLGVAVMAYDACRMILE